MDNKKSQARENVNVNVVNWGTRKGKKILTESNKIGKIVKSTYYYTYFTLCITFSQ